MHVHDDNRSILPPSLTLPDEAATHTLGSALAAALHALLVTKAPAHEPAWVLYLEGDLGAGKTTLVRSLLTRLGHEGKVKSPTYTFVEPYAISSLDLYHFDFYRFNSPEEFLDGGFDEYFTAPAVCLVEWPDKAAPYLPAADLRLLLDIRETGRLARLVAASPRGAQWLSILEPFLQALLPSTPAAASCSASPPPR